MEAQASFLFFVIGCSLMLIIPALKLNHDNVYSQADLEEAFAEKADFLRIPLIFVISGAITKKRRVIFECSKAYLTIFTRSHQNDFSKANTCAIQGLMHRTRITAKPNSIVHQMRPSIKQLHGPSQYPCVMDMGVLPDDHQVLCGQTISQSAMPKSENMGGATTHILPLH